VGDVDDDFVRYRILRPVGEGGMGTVYLAEQREPIRRDVALKVVKLGMDTSQVLARFANERQALAMMDHPNIARIFDAGATAKGRPYFVMEYIEGVPSRNIATAIGCLSSNGWNFFSRCAGRFNTPTIRA
jgi:eukaryotic-like serine/threonine-protein kinase